MPKPDIQHVNSRIVKATAAQIAAIAPLYDQARAFMRSQGNMHQWTGDYPSAQSLALDIAKGNSYLVEADGAIAATFYFERGIEPTYAQIYDGQWLNDEPYGVVHRAASAGTYRGVMHRILDYCATQVSNLRIDTHRDNTVMQQALLRYGFRYCGIIYLANGDERLAYQYVAPKSGQ